MLQAPNGILHERIHSNVQSQMTNDFYAALIIKAEIV